MEKYIELAKSFGASNVIAVTPDDIVFDARTLLKCMYGCQTWGVGPTCPSRPGALKPWEMEPLLRMYKTVIIIHSPDKAITQNASFAVEREAFFDGDVMSFSMSDCALCSKCVENVGEPCRNVMKARPSFHSVGINVFATAKKLNLPIAPAREESDPVNWYAAVWLN